MIAAGNVRGDLVGAGSNDKGGDRHAEDGDSSVGHSNYSKKSGDTANRLPEITDPQEEAEAKAVAEKDPSSNSLPPSNTGRHDDERMMASPSLSSPFPSNSCQVCRRLVLGHPLDTISARCGGTAPQDTQGWQPIGAAALLPPVVGTERVIACQEGRAIGAAAATADTEHAWKRLALANLPKSAGGTGSGRAATAGCRQGKRNSGVGASAISQVSQHWSCDFSMKKAWGEGGQ